MNDMPVSNTTVKADSMRRADPEQSDMQTFGLWLVGKNRKADCYWLLFFQLRNRPV